MAVIHIDGQEYEVSGADNLLQTCLSLGLDVPYFCWHPAMGAVGSCRQCAVKQYQTKEDYEAGRGRIVMSCMVAPNDDMYISIDDDEAVKFRQAIIELLMTNHPHDCPTCEEGGHCHLQDMTYMSGHEFRRYRFTKRTHINQDLGPFIAHEMNRCIACYRCVRYYQDYAGGEDLGVYSSANRVYFGRPEDGQFENEFSGNLTEICPTGVFTDKTHSERYNRKWDMQYAPSICHGCSSGCNISPGERYGELRRIENRYNYDVNGYFLCDKGRFAYGYVNRNDRPVQAIELINDKQVKISLDYALDETYKRINHKKIFGIGSPRASLETNYALKRLVGAENFSIGLNKEQASLVQLVTDILRTEGIYTPTLHDIETYDAVLILGEDITQTAPRVALSVRQAAKNKAYEMTEATKTPTWLAEPVKRVGQDHYSPVYIIDTTQTKLDDVATSCIATPSDISQLGFCIADAVAGKSLNTNLDAQTRRFAVDVAQTLLDADKPLIISGTSLFDASIIESAAQIAQNLTDAGQSEVHDEAQANPAKTIEVNSTPKQAGLYLCVPDANSIGIILLGGQPLTANSADGYDVVMVAENTLTDVLSAAEVTQLIDNKTIIALDHQFLDWHCQVDLLLPAASFAEGDGTLISAEGRAQRFFQVYDPSYYNPKNYIKEGWRWLHAIQSDLDKKEVNWTLLDHVIKDLVKDYEHLAAIVEAAPSSNYRIEGLKIAREPRRYSGRTAMRAPLSVHEPMQPKDIDTALTFSMEGYVGERTEGSLIPFAQAPGWNSPQAWNKFQDEVGGRLKNSDPGVRLLEQIARLPRRDYVKPLLKADSLLQVACTPDINPSQGAKTTSQTDDGTDKLDGVTWQLVPVYEMFATGTMSLRSPIIAEQLKPAVIVLNADDAQYHQIAEDDWVEITTEAGSWQLPVQLREYFPQGSIGYPFGRIDLLSPNQSVSIRKVSMQSLAVVGD